jgi:phosphoesterase family protein/phospholipase C-like protein
VLDALTSNPEVWSKTTLFITYDENDGFFDHMVPPTPPFNGRGKSMVDATNEIFPGSPGNPRWPYGLGFRVPMLVVSPRSKGGWVCSEVFDHTSLIQFIERRFASGRPDLIESNITGWRPAICGDLTTAFDFKRPNDRQTKLPDTTSYEPPDRVRHPDYVPAPPTQQEQPSQEPGLRHARALPYELDPEGRVDTAHGAFRIDFSNTGKTGVCFQVLSGNSADLPRTYTVEARKSLFDSWTAGAGPARSVRLRPQRLPPRVPGLHLLHDEGQPQGRVPLRRRRRYRRADHRQPRQERLPNHRGQRLRQRPSGHPPASLRSKRSPAMESEKDLRLVRPVDRGRHGPRISALSGRPPGKRPRQRERSGAGPAPELSATRR